MCRKIALLLLLLIANSAYCQTALQAAEIKNKTVAQLLDAESPIEIYFDYTSNTSGPGPRYFNRDWILDSWGSKITIKQATVVNEYLEELRTSDVACKLNRDNSVEIFKTYSDAIIKAGKNIYFVSEMEFVSEHGTVVHELPAAWKNLIRQFVDANPHQRTQAFCPEKGVGIRDRS